MTRPRAETDPIILLAERVLGELLDDLPRDRRSDLLQRVAALVEDGVGRERSRCVQLCRDRAALWQRTAAGAVSGASMAREEVRARANEALYLADLFDQFEEPAAEPPN